MTGVHFFPRYSQKENTVTNNTLLFFSRVYSYKPQLLESLFNSALEDQDLVINVGLSFSQQSRSQGSIPDAVISQDPFQIVVETKLYQNFDVDQMNAHANYFLSHRSANDILLWIAPTKPRPEDEAAVQEYIKRFNREHNRNVQIGCTTFAELLKVFESLVVDRDLEMHDLFTEFESYCRDEDLFPPRYGLQMRVVLCGHSIELNKKYGIYFHPRDRGYSPHAFVGCYKKKSVRAIGRLLGIVDAELDLETDSLTIVSTAPPTPGAPPLLVDDDIKHRLKAIIKETRETVGWPIEKDHTFFIVDRFVETDFKKSSPRGIQGARFFDLEERLEGDYSEDDSTEELAAKLDGLAWTNQNS